MTVTFEIKPWAEHPKKGPAGEWVLFTDKGCLSKNTPMQTATKAVNLSRRTSEGRLYKIDAHCSLKLRANYYRQWMETLEQLMDLLASGHTVRIPLSVQSIAEWGDLKRSLAQPTPPTPPF